MNLEIIAAPDSFKGSLGALQAAEAIKRGILKEVPEASVVLIPIADGGEGTVDAFLASVGGSRVPVRATGPLGGEVEAFYGVLEDGSTAVVEAAAACGLHLLRPEERDPFRATTRGVGEILLHAAAGGCRRIILGVGGSATNDGGSGMLRALGARFLDGSGREIPEGARGLEKLAEIDLSGWLWPSSGLEVVLAADVKNPLCGTNGASFVYGPQKFSPDAPPSEADLRALDSALERMARVSAEVLGRDLSGAEGAGAAGGLGFAAMAFLGASVRPGAELVLEAARFDERLAEADMVFTGEGSIDRQTLFGKAVMRVCSAAVRRGVPVVALAGSIDVDEDVLRRLGLSAWASIAVGPSSLSEMCADAELLLERAAAGVMRWLNLGRLLAAKPRRGVPRQAEGG